MLRMDVTRDRWRAVNDMGRLHLTSMDASRPLAVGSALCAAVLSPAAARRTTHDREHDRSEGEYLLMKPTYKTLPAHTLAIERGVVMARDHEHPVGFDPEGRASD